MKEPIYALVSRNAPVAVLGTAVGILVALLSHSPKRPWYDSGTIGTIAAIGTVGVLSIRWEDPNGDRFGCDVTRDEYFTQAREHIRQAAIEAAKPQVDIVPRGGVRFAEPR